MAKTHEKPVQLPKDVKVTIKQIGGEIRGDVPTAKTPVGPPVKKPK